MRDKEWTDTEWLDSGWADMERRLDEVMPVREPRRRAMLWWWSGTLALLVLAGLGWWRYAPAPRIDYFPLPTLGRAQVAVPPAVPSTITAPETRSLSATEPIVATESSEASPPTVSQQESTSSPRTAFREAASRPPASRIAVADSPEAEQVKPTRLLEDRKITSRDASNRIEPITSPAALSSDRGDAGRSSIRDTKLIAGLDWEPVHSLNERAIEKAIVPVRGGTWLFGVEATVNTDGVGANGTSLGLLLRRSGYSRWSADIGLRYHYWEQTWGTDQSFRNNRSEDAQSPDTSAFWVDPSIAVYRVARSGGETYRILVARDPADNPRIRTHWLELPIRVNYRFGRRWEATAGLRPALLLNSQISVPAVAESTTAESMNPASIPLSNDNTDELTSSGSQGVIGPSGRILQRSHLGWEVGLNYRLSPDWTLGVQYRRGQNVWQRDSELRSRTGLAGLRLVHWW